MTEIAEVPNTESVPGEATHRVDISLYIKASSDEGALKVAFEILEEANAFPEVIKAVPRIEE